jgi:Carboxypeptidase regulatory-like domain
MNSKTNLGFLVRFLMFLTLGMLLATPSNAQELRATVQGIVTDASGGVLVGATVTLRNVKTGVEVNRVANEAGRYLFDFVSPGTYTVTIEMAGFSTFVQENVLVQTRGDITVNGALQVRNVSETVVVRESPVAVKFNTSTMELTLDTKMTNELPIVHRNPFLLATLNPAVIVRSTTEQSPYHHWAASQLDVGGNTSTKNDILVDGVPQLVGMKGTYVPTMDAVSEVSIQQNSVDSEFGHSAGGIIAVQMKSGTNEHHGTAYYFGRNPALNAVADHTNRRPNEVRNHVWGVTSGNPIIRGKVFNYFSYEAQNVREPRTMTATLPTDREREGDFSQTFNSAGGLRLIYDPWTTRLDPATNTATRTPFPNNIIPASRIDSTARRFLMDIWKPNGAGDNITGANNYRYTFPQKFEYWNLSDRVDWVVNDKWSIFGRGSRFHTVQSDPNFTGSPAQQLAGSNRHTVQLSGDAVWTMNPTTVFNLRGSYSKIVDSFEAENARIEPKTLQELWPNNPWYEPYQTELPALYYPGLTVVSETNSLFGREGFWYQEPTTWNLQSKISKQVGRHYVKVGGEFRQQRFLASRPQPMGFRFEKSHTADTYISPDTRLRGDGWASFLLGIVDSQSRIRTIPLNRPRDEFYGLYIQDDFKLSPRITLNLGLRWEYETPMKDPELRLSRYLDLTNPIPEFQTNPPQFPTQVTSLGAPPPILNGAWIFTDDDHRGAWEGPKTLFMPRVGIAYRINERMALRAGYARYLVQPIQAFDFLGSTPYPGFDAVTNPLGLLEGIPRARISDPYPANENPLVPAVGKTLGRYTSLGGPATWFVQDWRNETNDRINISLQREMWNKMVVDVTYFLNVGHDQRIDLPVNRLDPRLTYQHKTTLTTQVNNPFYNILPPDKFPGQLRNTQRVSIGSLLVPYPQYGDLIINNGMPGASTRYQAFQLQVQRQFAGGYNFLLGYNYNRGRGMEFFDDVDTFDQMLSWQESSAPRQKFTLAGIWELPFGRGRHFMANSNAVVDGFLGGWSLSGIYQYLGGDFLRFGALEQTGDPRLEDPSNEARFNTAVFARKDPFTRRYNPKQYEGVTGPSFWSVDMTLSKEYRIAEKLSFEIRMEAYNLTNSFIGANPSTDVTSSIFGRVVNQRAGVFGRQLQYSGRFRW